MINLIINADDFWYSYLFNKRILELVESRSVSAVSVMVDEINENQLEQIEKLKFFSETGLVSCWLHVFFKSQDYETQLNNQYSKFVEIFWFKPSHIDIHKFEHLENWYKVIQELCKKENIPCKNLSWFWKSVDMIEWIITTKSPVFSATWIPFIEIRKWLDWLSDDDTYLINFHPWYFDPESKTSLNKDREIDALNIVKVVKYISNTNISIVKFSTLK